MKILWIEEYRCGCSSEANLKRDLLGYCEIHGESRRNIYKIPIGEAAKILNQALRGGGDGR